MDTSSYICVCIINYDHHYIYVQLPSIIWLKIMKPPRFSISWIMNWVKQILSTCLFTNGVIFCDTKPGFFCVCEFQISIFFGVFLMVASTVGGLRNIVADSSSYEFYS